MLAVASTTRVYLYMQLSTCDDRTTGLHAIVQSEFARDIRLGDNIMFINRRRIESRSSGGTEMGWRFS